MTNLMSENWSECECKVYVMFFHLKKINASLCEETESNFQE